MRPVFFQRLPPPPCRIFGSNNNMWSVDTLTRELLCLRNALLVVLGDKCALLSINQVIEKLKQQQQLQVINYII